jgi:D-alanyl-D-alanine carboxypeptidase-like protein
LHVRHNERDILAPRQESKCGVALRNVSKLRPIAGAAIAFFLAAFADPNNAEKTYGAAPPDIKSDLDHLVSAYPDWIARYDDEFLVLKDGTKFSISDHRTDKSFEELLEAPDIDDMFFVPYPAGTQPRQPPRNFDPGRVRFEPLLNAMYGDCSKNAVAGKLRTIEWLPQHRGGHVAITASNGVDKALQAVSRELDQLPAELIKYAMPSAGTYNCRAIAGSRARSMHAYGAAIDLNTHYSDYWRWAAKNGADPVWKNQIPIEIVRAFEKHGFIWGGYWYHFDTMHFEYRPELLPAFLSPLSK